ncbi:MAG: response regulator [Candidatus Scalinduaceae bacterium]
MPQHKINILVIDDDKDMCSFLKEFLIKEGYNVKTLTRPDRALHEIREKTYHVITLDLKMANKRGEDLLKGIKKINSDIPVIILTAYPSLESAVETLKDNAFDYIKKPFKIDDIRKTIKKALRSRRLLIEKEEKLNIKIGERVKELRNENKLTLKQLAERTDLSVSLISQIERAESAASILTLSKIVTALNMRLEEFFQDI